MTIDDELHRAADDLRQELRTVTPPPLRRLGNEQRTDTGGRFVLAVASFVVVVIGGLFLANRAPAGEDLDATATVPDAESPVQADPDDPVDDGAASDVGEEAEQVEPDSAVLALPEGSPAWNANGTLLLLYEVGVDGGGHALYNGTNLERMRRLDIDPVDIEQVYWDPNVPELIHYVSGVELIAHDVFTDASDVTHRFDDCDAVQSRGVAQPIASDGQRAGFLCLRDGGADLVALDLGTGQEVRRPAADAASVGPVPLPGGAGYVARSDAGVVEVFDEALEPTGVRFTVGTDQFVVIGTEDGRQLLVTPVFNQPEAAIGSVVGFDLGTGEPVVAIGESAGDPYPPSGTRLAAAVNGSAKVVVTIVGDPDAVTATSLDGTTLVVDFEPITPTITTVERGQAWVPNPGLNPYWSAPHPAIDPAGSRVLFPPATGERAIRPVIVDLDEDGTP